jgi:hypothetical protein
MTRKQKLEEIREKIFEGTATEDERKFFDQEEAIRVYTLQKRKKERIKAQRFGEPKPVAEKPKIKKTSDRKAYMAKYREDNRAELYEKRKKYYEDHKVGLKKKRIQKEKEGKSNA